MTISFSFCCCCCWICWKSHYTIIMIMMMIMPTIFSGFFFIFYLAVWAIGSLSVWGQLSYRIIFLNVTFWLLLLLLQLFFLFASSKHKPDHHVCQKKEKKIVTFKISNYKHDNSELVSVKEANLLFLHTHN